MGLAEVDSAQDAIKSIAIEGPDLAFFHRPALPGKRLCVIPIPSRRCFRSIRRSVPASPAAALVAWSVWIMGLVIPNEKLTLRAGADQAHADARLAGMPGRPDAPCRDGRVFRATRPGTSSAPEHRRWVIDGSPNWNGKWNQHWFGVKRFFEYLETKAYKMHIRVLLSKYRSYTPCGTCGGARLKTESLLWRVGSKDQADAVLDPAKRFMPAGVKWSREQLESLPGLCLHDLMLLPLDKLRRFFDALQVGLGGTRFGGRSLGCRQGPHTFASRLPNRPPSTPQTPRGARQIGIPNSQ
jgi:hypothetical protein